MSSRSPASLSEVQCRPEAPRHRQSASKLSTATSATSARSFRAAMGSRRLRSMARVSADRLENLLQAMTHRGQFRRVLVPRSRPHIALRRSRSRVSLGFEQQQAAASRACDRAQSAFRRRRARSPRRADALMSAALAAVQRADPAQQPAIWPSRRCWRWKGKVRSREALRFLRFPRLPKARILAYDARARHALYLRVGAH